MNKMKLILAMILTCSSCFMSAQQGFLIPVEQKGKRGYINLDGEIVIPLKYKHAQEFSEGFAGVREGGLFGFIDTKGIYVIPSIYDSVEKFSNGYAKAWIDGKCRLIDKKGNPLFIGNYKYMDFHKDGDKIWVTTWTDKDGLVDLNGAILMDTILKNIEYYGMAIADSSVKYYLGVVDKNVCGLINTRNEFEIIDFLDKEATKHILQKDKETYDDDESERKGRFRLIEYPEYNFQLYDSDSSLVTKQVFHWCNYRGCYFDENAIVAISHKGKNEYDYDKRWGVIDTTGTFIIPPIYRDINRLKTINSQYYKINLPKGIDEYFTLQDSSDYHLNSVYNIKTQKVILPMRDWYFDIFTYKHPDNDTQQVTIIQAMLDSLYHYYTLEGNKIWEHKKENYNWNDVVSQRPSIYQPSSGDFGKKENPKIFGSTTTPKRINDKSNIHPKFPRNKLSLLVTTDSTLFHFYIANRTKDTLDFVTFSGNIHVRMQAKDKNGAWQYIEFFSAEGCGNSYGHRILQPNGYWEFLRIAPKGIFKTELRMVLIPTVPFNYSEKKYRNYLIYDGGSWERDQSKWIYSNSFEGYINPAQLWQSKGLKKTYPN